MAPPVRTAGRAAGAALRLPSLPSPAAGGSPTRDCRADRRGCAAPSSCASVMMRLTSASICCAVLSAYTPRSCGQPELEKTGALVTGVVDGADRVAHAPLGDHRAGDVGGALQIVLCACRNLAQCDLFCGSAAEEDGELVPQVGARHQVAILERQLHRVAERTEAALDDRNLVHRIQPGQHRRDDCVTGLVVGDDLAARARSSRASSRGRRPGDRWPPRSRACPRRPCPCAPPAARPRSRGWRDRRRRTPPCGPRPPAGPRSGATFTLRRVDPEDRLAAIDVRPVHEHLSIEPARTQQRRVEHFRPVGRGHDDHALRESKPSISARS